MQNTVTSDFPSGIIAYFFASFSVISCSVEVLNTDVEDIGGSHLQTNMAPSVHESVLHLSFFNLTKSRCDILMVFLSQANEHPKGIMTPRS